MKKNHDLLVCLFGLLIIFALVVGGGLLSRAGHWEETGNIVPARDDTMFVKHGDFLLPIPIHRPAEPEKRWVWNK